MSGTPTKAMEKQRKYANLQIGAPTNAMGHSNVTML